MVIWIDTKFMNDKCLLRRLETPGMVGDTRGAFGLQESRVTVLFVPERLAYLSK